MIEKATTQQQAQQEWAKIAAQNYANATTHGIHRAINNNPSFGCEIDAQYVQETADLANAKGFLSKFHAESENTEFLENLRKQWGPPSNMTIADGNLVDCRQIGTKDKARVSTNGLDKNLASTLQGKSSDASVDCRLKTSMLNKKLFGHATRFGNAVASLHSRRHNPAPTVRPMPRGALLPAEPQEVVARRPLPPQVTAVTPAAGKESFNSFHGTPGYHESASPPLNPRRQRQMPGIDVQTLHQMQNRSLRDSQILTGSVIHDVETGAVERLPTDASARAKRRYKSLTMDNTDAAIAFAGNMAHVRPDADSQEACFAYDAMFDV
jgi:ribosome-binding factor A